MFKRIFAAAAVIFIALSLNACSTMIERPTTMGGKPAPEAPPALYKSTADIPKGQSSYHWMPIIYPGVGEKFNPRPKLTLKEYNYLGQLDWYCADKVDALRPLFIEEMGKQGLTYGFLEAIIGGLGANLAFGPAAPFGKYATYIGLTAGAGGLASGKLTVDMALSVAHGYCMTGMVYKADEIDGELKRIFIVPLYTGHVPLPEVSNDPAPKAKGPSKVKKATSQKSFVPAPPTR